MVDLSTGSKNAGRLLTVDRFSYAYPEADSYTLRDVSLVIRPGECHLLEGPTGSGKSTLLLAIRGVLPPGRTCGHITLNTAESEVAGSGVALIQQNPKTQLLYSTLGADVAFGLENHCTPPERMLENVQQVLRQTGLERPVEYPVDSLSMGQQYRACVAGQLVLEPKLVLLDEPVAQLDPAGREKMMQLVQRLKKLGIAVLICEHQSRSFGALIDRAWVLGADGQLRAKTAAPSAGARGNDLCLYPSHQQRPAGSTVRPAIVIRGLQLQHEGREIDLRHVEIEVDRGECVVLHGPNGCGKTTLVRAMAGLIPARSGLVEVLGEVACLNNCRDRVSVLFQNPAQQLFETAVFEEVAFAARRSGMKEPEVAIWVELLLDKLGILGLAMDSPHKLSYGQKHLVGFAAVLAARPEIVLLDDPFAGLDKDKRTRVGELLKWLMREQGMTVVWTTHDRTSVADWPTRVIDLAPAPVTRPGRQQANVPGADPKRNSRNRRESEQGAFALPTLPMLLFTVMLSMLAFAAGTPETRISLSLVNLVLILLFSPKPIRFVQKSAVFFAWQALLVVLLYGLRFGFFEGTPEGVRVAWQLFLAFWPGMIFMSANSQARIAQAFSRVLPHRTAFVASVCLRFLPTLLAEMQKIREVQILRGARLSMRDLAYPKNWPDWIFCLAIPTLITTLSLAGEIAVAATVRDFGCHEQRTCWPGD